MSIELTELTPNEKNTLLKVAHDSIEHGLTHRCALPIELEKYSSTLQLTRATFVTLHLMRALRGCIGMLNATRPLVEDVAENAFAAAFGDPRFGPVNHGEFLGIEIHLSILSPPQPMVFTSESDLLDQIRPGVDGLILSDGEAKGTFLPSVWEQLPDKQQFWLHLKNKANLPHDYWSNTLTVQRYTAQLIP